MVTYGSPGLYRQALEPKVRLGPLIRGDITVFLGYARRGPACVPIRIQSLSQFEQVFGSALNHGFLWPGIKGFFECGGRIAYVLRLCGPTNRNARADVGGGWLAEASFPWSRVDPRRLAYEQDPEIAIWSARVESEIRDGGPRRSDPGSWGNQLEVQIRRTSRLITKAAALSADDEIDDPISQCLARGTASRPDSLAGLEAFSVVELTQTGTNGESLVVERIPERIDTNLGLVYWKEPLQASHLNPNKTLLMATVEFDVEVRFGGTSEQIFMGLAPHPQHSKAMGSILSQECRSLTLHHPKEAISGTDWSHPSNWPHEGMHQLTGAVDGLESVNGATWDGGLAQLMTLPDASLVAAPDLMLPAMGWSPTANTISSVEDCGNLWPRSPGYLDGLVTSINAAGDSEPLDGVMIDVAGIGSSAITDDHGRFHLSGVVLGLVQLRLSKDGFVGLETVAQSTSFPGQGEHSFILEKLTAPPVLAKEERLRLQLAMGNPAVVGPYKVAVIDPPDCDCNLESLKAWRTSLGDNARLGMVAPWLMLPAAEFGDGLLACPASGHVCGAFAHAELLEGIHRSGANLPLRYVESTSLSFTDAQQAELNPLGINAIRAFPGRGIRLYGTRSLAYRSEWMFMTTRRIIDGIERTMERALAWMIFERNSELTRQAVQTSCKVFLDRIYRQGILAGNHPDGAYQVKCDLENNTQDSRDDGRLVLDVAVAPTIPFEFIVFRIGHSFDALQITEGSR